MIQFPIWWLFLLLAPAIYWTLPAQYRMAILAIMSLGLLMWIAFVDVFIMVALSGLVFVGLNCQHRLVPKWFRQLAGTPTLFWLVLIYFIWAKYLPALGHLFSGQGSFGTVVIPLGVSYFSFKLLHYVIEKKRNNFPEHNIGDFSAWMFLAPIFTAGPIERFEHFLAERQIAQFDKHFLVEGILRIAIGLVKKFVLGFLVYKLLVEISGGGLLALSHSLDTLPIWSIWICLFLTLAYVYLDFSAYSDIAIGSARLFGLRIMENFNMPFLATSLQKFWQRWHMSLANWCRTYIYMGMIGITRNPYWAVLATFFVMGLWHAADLHWMAWGVWHGMGLMWLLFWGRFAARRKITFFRTNLGQLVGWACTMSYVALGGAFTALHGQGIDQSLQLMAAAFGIRF